MPIIDIDIIEAQLADYVEKAAAGEEFVIAEAGTPRAKKLGPLAPIGRKKRRLGLLTEQMTIPTDFDAPLPDHVLNVFEGH
ncbi:MAG: type II toxin-antitoxin system Phd/YefM family antitoxin [Sciscionella sp.]